MNNVETLLLFGGYKLVASDLLVEYTSREVPRSIKERLFTRPWRPFKKTKTIHYTEPKMDVLVSTSERSIIAHPVVIERLRNAVEQSVRGWRT